LTQTKHNETLFWVKAKRLKSVSHHVRKSTSTIRSDQSKIHG